MQRDEVIVGFTLKKCGDVSFHGGGSFDAQTFVVLHAFDSILAHDHHVLKQRSAVESK